MSYIHTTTLGELKQSYRTGSYLFLCETVMDMFWKRGKDCKPENYIVDVIEVFQREFPRHVSSRPIEPYERILDGYIIDPNVRDLPCSRLRRRLLADLVDVYGGDYLLTFTITF